MPNKFHPSQLWENKKPSMKIGGLYKNTSYGWIQEIIKIYCNKLEITYMEPQDGFEALSTLSLLPFTEIALSMKLHSTHILCLRQHKAVAWPSFLRDPWIRPQSFRHQRKAVDLASLPVARWPLFQKRSPQSQVPELPRDSAAPKLGIFQTIALW